MNQPADNDLQPGVDLFIAIHGILGGVTRRDALLDFSVHVQRLEIPAFVMRREYRAGPLPFVNRHWTNPRAAKGFAAAAILAIEELGNVRRIFVVTHSNGGNIGVMVMREMSAAGHRVNGCVLIASATHSDVRVNGLLDLTANHGLERAVVYWSDQDRIIAPRQSYPGPYGSHGARGHELGREPYGQTVSGVERVEYQPGFLSREFPGFGHSQYFDHNVKRVTFDLALHDLGVSAPTTR